jgi:hypothetical protein
MTCQIEGQCILLLLGAQKQRVHYCRYSHMNTFVLNFWSRDFRHPTTALQLSRDGTGRMTEQ